MRRTIRTTTIVLGVVAATGLGLTTAVAASDTDTPTATPTATATATTVAASDEVTAQPPPSYQLKSSIITVPVDPLRYPTSHGLCADNFHVAGDWSTALHYWQYVPSVHANGDSDIYVDDTVPDENTQNGTDSDGNPYYQGLSVTLGNHSWTHSEQGTFTWTCEPN